MEWEKYQPIGKLLEKYGATDSDGQVESSDDVQIREQRAKEWQANKK